MYTQASENVTARSYANPAPVVPDPSTPLELRIDGLKEISQLLGDEISELRLQLSAILAPDVPPKAATVSEEPQGPTPAPLVMQLGEIEDCLRRLKNELHMIRCRACC